jgi:hypothetical protein
VIAYDGTHNSRRAVQGAGAHVLRHGGRPVLVVPPER